jgi:hypothetical protein
MSPSLPQTPPPHPRIAITRKVHIQGLMQAVYSVIVTSLSLSLRRLPTCSLSGLTRSMPYQQKAIDQPGSPFLEPLTKQHLQLSPPPTQPQPAGHAIRNTLRPPSLSHATPPTALTHLAIPPPIPLINVITLVNLLVVIPSTPDRQRFRDRRRGGQKLDVAVTLVRLALPLDFADAVAALAANVFGDFDEAKDVFLFFALTC